MTQILKIDKVKHWVYSYPDYLATISVYIVTTTLMNSWCIATAVVLPISLLLILPGGSLFKKLEQNTRYIMVTNFTYTGRGLSSRSIRTLVKIFRIFIVASVLALGHTLSYPTLSKLGIRVLLPLILGLCATITYFFPRIYVVFLTSQRKTEVEVEMPYAMVFLRTLAPLRLPVYELIEMIEGSVSLKAFAKEIKFAKKIASTTSSSLLTALDILMASHPSERMRELFRRVVLVAGSVGDIKEVVEKVFEEVYTWFESKVSALVEKFTIVVGTALFAYFFAPIVVATVAPLVGVTALPIIVSILSIYILAFFLLYALISSIYPSSLVVKPSKSLKITGITSIIISLSLATANIFISIAGWYSDDRVMITLLAASLGVPMVLAERNIIQSKFYDKFIRMASDTLSFVASTGENIAKTLLETSKKYGEKMRKFVTLIVSGYTSTTISRAIIVRAPSLYHSMFIELLLTVLRLGFKPEALKTFATSYEKLSIAINNVKRVANMLEAVMIGLSAIVGGFLAYLNKVYNYMWSLVARAGGTWGLGLALAYPQNVYIAIDALAILSMLLLSILVGKVRGGSILYFFRTALTMIILYTVSKYIVLSITF